MKFDSSLALEIGRCTEAEAGTFREMRRTEGESERLRVPSDDEVPDGFDTTSGKQNGVTTGERCFPGFPSGNYAEVREREKCYSARATRFDRYLSPKEKKSSDLRNSVPRVSSLFLSLSLSLSISRRRL
jgi:hypothetical protein